MAVLKKNKKKVMSKRIIARNNRKQYLGTIVKRISIICSASQCFTAYIFHRIPHWTQSIAGMTSAFVNMIRLFYWIIKSLPLSRNDSCYRTGSNIRLLIPHNAGRISTFEMNFLCPITLPAHTSTQLQHGSGSTRERELENTPLQ